MVLPLSLIRTSQQNPVLVELKTGETLSGILVNSDNWMNMELADVVLTAKDGERFHQVAQVFVRGNNVKFVRVPDEVIDVVKDEVLRASAAAPRGRGGRGGFASRGGRGARNQY